MCSSDPPSPDVESDDVALDEGLAGALEALSTRPRCRAFAARAREQLQQCDAKLTSLLDILATRLDKQELTYQRQKAIAHEIHEGVGQNLQAIVDSLRIIEHIDSDDLRERLAQAGPGASNQETRQQAALEERLNLYDTHVEQMENLFTRNEEALTVLLKAATALASLRSLDGKDVQLGAALDDLTRLAERIAAQQPSRPPW